MDLNKKLEELKPYQLNCNVFDVYSYNGLTMQDLLCQFFTKINECITVSNETIDLAKWLVNEGLEIEVVKKLMIWLEDGTLENIINVNLFKTLHDKITNVEKKINFIESEKLPCNVKDFGAKGDGLTDDTLAFQNAINSSLNVYIPNGEYVVNDTLNITNEHQTIFGESRENTKIIHKGTDPLIIISNGSVKIERMSFKNINSNWDEGVCLLLVNNVCCYGWYKDLQFEGFGKCIEFGDNNWMQNIEYCTFKNSNIGISSGYASNHINVNRCDFTGLSSAINIISTNKHDGALNYNIENSRFEWNYKGIYIQTPGIVNIKNNYFERHKSIMIHVDVYEGWEKSLYTLNLENNSMFCNPSDKEWNFGEAVIITGANNCSSVSNHFESFYKKVFGGLDDKIKLTSIGDNFKDIELHGGVKFDNKNINIINKDEFKIQRRRGHVNYINNGYYDYLTDKDGNDKVMTYLEGDDYGVKDLVSNREFIKSSLGSVEMITAKNFVPREADTYSLGSSNNYWNNIYVRTITQIGQNRSVLNREVILNGTTILDEKTNKILHFKDGCWYDVLGNVVD